MTDRRAPPPLVDDDDEEETLIDLAPRGAAPSESAPVPSLEPPPERPLPHSLVGGDDDEDPTELMRPNLPARRATREIQAGGGVRPLSGLTDAATTVRLEAPPSITDEPDTDGPVFREVPVFRDSLDDAPPVRPLESLPPIDVDEAPDDLTLSRPKVVRMSFGRDDPSSPPPPAPEPDFRPTDNALRGRSLLRDEPPEEEAAAPAPLPLPDAEPGTLIVEAPDEAVVFIDGVERGRGVQEVRGVDRYARLSVRIHCTGYEPWSALVSLGGKAVARVSPSLRRR